MPPLRWLRSRRSSGLAIAAAALLVTGLGMWTNTARAIEHLIEPVRFGLMHRTASQQVVLVEMDAASMAAIRQWPWSRAHYGAVVDRLRAAGAGAIVFDVDFSAPSDTAGDNTFATALTRASDLVVLPTFAQRAGAKDSRTIDAVPIPLFRRHVALASVSVAPGSDGVVREMPFATMTAGTPRPSLATYIAGRSGTVDQTFPIDMSIDRATIPTLSFVAVREGRFNPAAVRGKSVLIGATAIEMGDRFGTAGHGVIPGVVIQALAAETLIRGVPIKVLPILPEVLALLLALLMLRATTLRSLAGSATTVLATFIGLVCAAQYGLALYAPLAGGIVVLTVTFALTAARLLILRFQDMRLVDEATGLPTRRAMTARHADDERATVVAWIANYEDLLAVLGSAAAPDILRRVVDRLRLVASDEQVFRIGERSLAFRLPSHEQVDELMEGLRSIMLRPIEVTGRRFDVVTALGVVEHASDSLDRALNEATRAAERASDDGAFWQRAATDVGALERSLSLMGELDQAIGDNALSAYYQPKLDLRSGRIVSAEALVRWQHPERGFVPPDMFIPMAEQTDRIAPLTLFMLNRVLEDLATLRTAGHALSFAINISAKLLTSASFTQEVERLVAASAMTPSALVLEVTESAAMSDPERAVAALARFRALGVSVSMDDYGTGQSTLTYLRQLPLNELKIDRSFVQHAHRNRNDGLLVKSTVELAHELNLKVVAEGVEHRDCLDFLTSIGCDMAQGYIISRPLPFAEFFRLLESGECGYHASI